MAGPLYDYLPEDIVNGTTVMCGQLFDMTCCTKFVQNFDLHDEQCIKLFVVKLLGYGIIVLGSTVKLPQVFKMLAAKSGAGISLVGVMFELMAIVFNSCYSFRNNFPFSAWGEAVFLAIETATIAFLVLWYDGHKNKALSFLAISCAIVYTLLQPTLVSSGALWWLQSSVLYLAVSGKGLQAIKNYKAQHTGQISAVTAGAIFAGSLVRIFTTIQETGDALTTVTFMCSSTANAVIFCQVLWYWKLTQDFIEKGKKKKAE